MKALLKLFNGIISFIMGVVLVSAGVYAGYCLWDNSRIYAAAENVQAQLLSLKPTVTTDGEEETGPTFDELLAINPDVCAWVTIDNTGIDLPVLQGETNLSYINTDVYGNFALAGSIFLDCRNNREYTDTYSLLYGHHMEGGRMFGDLDLFKDETFFNENHTGTLITPVGSYSLEIFACLVVPSSQEEIFQPTNWTYDNIDELVEYARREAMFFDEDIVNQVYSAAEANEDDTVQVLALSTCSSEYTDARTVIFTFMCDPNAILTNGKDG